MISSTIMEEIRRKEPPSYQVLFQQPDVLDSAPTDRNRDQQPSVTVQHCSVPPITKIKSHITWSIVNIVLCCWCLGCVACCFSMRTRTLRRTGDIQGALEASRMARGWNVCSTMCGIIILLYLLVHLFYRSI